MTLGPNPCLYNDKKRGNEQEKNGMTLCPNHYLCIDEKKGGGGGGEQQCYTVRGDRIDKQSAKAFQEGIHKNKKKYFYSTSTVSKTRFLKHQ